MFIKETLAELQGTTPPQESESVPISEQFELKEDKSYIYCLEIN